MKSIKLFSLAWIIGTGLACGGVASGKSDGAGGSGATSGAGGGAATTGSGKLSDPTSGGSNSKTCSAGSVDANDPCEVCVVTSCTKQAKACCDHKGCLEIIDCARKTSCSDVDCYKPETCKQQIDDAGGLSVAVELAKPLGDCALASCKDACGM